MSKMTLRQLIQSKDFDQETQDELLKIAESESWVEDLLDYIQGIDKVATVNGIEIPID